MTSAATASAAGWGSDMRIKDIVGFEGVYAISDHGHVIRFYRAWRDRLNRLTMRSSRILVVPAGTDGYKTVRLFGPSGNYRREKVHRLVAEAFRAPYRGEMVNHIDGDRANNHYINLEWCDCAANLMHGHLRKAHIRLTATQIMEVRSLAGTVPLETLANRYDVDKTTIQRVIWGYKLKPR
jgi:hypothetical protein